MLVAASAAAIAASSGALSAAMAAAAAGPGNKAVRCVRRSGSRCSWYRIRDTSTGRTVFGSTPTAPRARAWLTYSSPSCEVYIISGIVAVNGSALMVCTAWNPSMPGIR